MFGIKMFNRIYCVLFLSLFLFQGKFVLAQKKDLQYYPKNTPPSYHKPDEAYAMRIDSSMVIDGQYDML